jgi:molecular chaperone DnaK (HSP70)
MSVDARNASPPPNMSNLASALATFLSLESKVDFIIGIDFGTTYTGVAYAEAVSRDAVKADPKRIAESIEIFRAWPNPTQNYPDKIPTVLAYNQDPPIWGGSVRPNHQPQIRHFKLGLQPGMGEHYGVSKSGARSILNFLDPNWENPVRGKNAVDFAADYLTCLIKYLKEEALPRQFGASYLDGLQIAYVVTVPAIWKDSAKSLTRQAAERAGIPRSKLELITEPEAAALYCATISIQVDLEDGDRFMVCDAGGGTVV